MLSTARVQKVRQTSCADWWSYHVGGLFSNTPVLQALREGATECLVILLDAAAAAPTVSNMSFAKGTAGPDILAYCERTPDSCCCKI